MAPDKPDSPLLRRGLMLVLSSPSGAGKTSVAKALLKSENNLSMSVSTTTRPPRPGEIDGTDYHFIEIGKFREMVDGKEFLEHAKVFDNYYGTPRDTTIATISSGLDMLFDIDWQGTQQLRENARNEVASIFILPPSLDELEQRLRKRGQDSAEVIRHRMEKAYEEMSHWPEYDYVVINYDLDQSVASVRAILQAERLKRNRQINLASFVNNLRQPACPPCHSA